MSDLTITEVRLVEKGEMTTAPMAEALVAGNAARYDSNGEWTGANATSESEANVKGLVLEVDGNVATVVGEDCLVQLGTALDSMNPGDKVVLSATDKAIADTAVGANETQTVTITGSPTGGDFTLTFDGQETSAIAYNAAASAVQSALEALSTIGVGNVSVTGSTGGPYTVEFINELADANVAALTADGSGLTGGTDPDVEIAEASAGVQYVEIGVVEPLHTYGGNSQNLLRIKIKQGA